MKNNTFTLGQPVYPAEIVNFVPLIREHPEKDTVNQYFPHTIFLVFFSFCPFIPCEGQKEIKWAIKLYLGEAPSISKLVGGEGAQFGS